MVLKREKYICSLSIEIYLVGSWFSTEKSIYINRAIALFIKQTLANLTDLEQNNETLIEGISLPSLNKTCYF